MPNASQTPIRSQLADDPEMAELITLFLQELPQRVDSMIKAWHTQELTALQRLAHQLKGSCAGYGFPTIGSAAARLEDDLRTKASGQNHAEKLTTDVNELIALCRRASQGTRNPKDA